MAPPDADARPGDSDDAARLKREVQKLREDLRSLQQDMAEAAGNTAQYKALAQVAEEAKAKLQVTLRGRPGTLPQLGGTMRVTCRAWCSRVGRKGLGQG